MKDKDSPFKVGSWHGRASVAFGLTGSDHLSPHFPLFVSLNSVAHQRARLATPLLTMNDHCVCVQKLKVLPSFKCWAR